MYEYLAEKGAFRRKRVDRFLSRSGWIGGDSSQPGFLPGPASSQLSPCMSLVLWSVASLTILETSPYRTWYTSCTLYSVHGSPCTRYTNSALYRTCLASGKTAIQCTGLPLRLVHKQYNVQAPLPLLHKLYTYHGSLHLVQQLYTVVYRSSPHLIQHLYTMKGYPETDTPDIHCTGFPVPGTQAVYCTGSHAPKTKAVHCMGLPQLSAAPGIPCIHCQRLLRTWYTSYTYSVHGFLHLVHQLYTVQGFPETCTQAGRCKEFPRT